MYLKDYTRWIGICTGLTDGDEKTMERLHYWILKFGFPEWDTVESESWLYSWIKWRKEQHNNSKPRESEFFKQGNTMCIIHKSYEMP